MNSFTSIFLILESDDNNSSENIFFTNIYKTDLKKFRNNYLIFNDSYRILRFKNTKYKIDELIDKINNRLLGIDIFNNIQIFYIIDGDQKYGKWINENINDIKNKINNLNIFKNYVVRHYSLIPINSQFEELLYYLYFDNCNEKYSQKKLKSLLKKEKIDDFKGKNTIHILKKIVKYNKNDVMNIKSKLSLHKSIYLQIFK